MSKEEKFKNLMDGLDDFKRLELILKLHKEGSIDATQAISLIQADKQFHKVKIVHEYPTYLSGSSTGIVYDSTGTSQYQYPTTTFATTCVNDINSGS